MPEHGHDFELSLDDGADGQPHSVENLRKAIFDPLGFELVTCHEVIELLVVQKAL